MLLKNIREALNNQVKLKAASSQAYLAMASWSEIQPGLEGVSKFSFSRAMKKGFIC